MKKAGILGTGMVGNTIGSALIQLGYEVKMGSRTPDSPKASDWVKTNGKNATQGTFADAAAFGNIVFNCTKGEHSLDVIQSVGPQNLAGKVLIDISNPLDFSSGMPPTLIPELSNTHSLGEAIQRLLPQTSVVKTLNMVNNRIMVNAIECGGEATMFVAGNDQKAKDEVRTILQQFGWSDIIDLGGIVHARSLEMLLPVWLSIYMAIKNQNIGFRIVR